MGGGGGLHRVPAFLNGVSQAYGPIASWHMLRGRFWFVDDAGLIETLMTAIGFVVEKGRGLRRKRRLLGLVPLPRDEQIYLNPRRPVTPALLRLPLGGLAPLTTALPHRS